ncbi:MAG: hypothetical protein A2156_00480 [Deltaproteobacteria bacterium RBG_16_48_10]|nr:MAG: hypothetical protein A2156_00480 [Deltaproteobacteria bacterium RBG_16_48_10]
MAIATANIDIIITFLLVSIFLHPSLSQRKTFLEHTSTLQFACIVKEGFLPKTFLDYLLKH